MDKYDINRNLLVRAYMNGQLTKDEYRKLLKESNHPKSWKPFESVDDIPEIPIYPTDEYANEVIPNIVRCGGIPKSNLQDGITYIGSCRNSSEGTWDAANNEFRIKRYKWGMWQDDTVQHYEDGAFNDNDVFVPIKEKE